MSKLWLPGEPVTPVYAVRNFGESWVRNAPQSFGQKDKPPNSGGGGGGKGGSALAAPTDLAATGNGSSQVDLTWTDTAGGEDGWKIERSANGSTGWTQVGTNAANDTTYSDTGLDASTQYYYRVRAYNGSRNGGYSNVDDGTTGAAGPGSSPAGWWAADAGTFQTQGGSAATADTDPVGEWQDQSGNARHLLQATAGSRPILKLSQINGKPCLRFDGSNDFVKALFTLDVPFQCFAVIKQISWTSGDTLLAGGANDNWAVAQASSSPIIRQWNGVATGNNEGNLAVGSWAILECNMPGAGAGNNSTRVNQGTATTNGGNTSLARGGICVGAHPAPTAYSNIDVAEIILYTSVLSGAALTAVYSYLNGRYGL